MWRLLAACLCLLPVAADWPHWRGPTRDGLTPEVSGYRAGRWVDKPLWSAHVGEGATSPILAEGRVFVLGHTGKHDQVVCLDAATGKEEWKFTYPAPRYARHHLGDENFYGGPTSTPAFDPDSKYLYTLGCDGDLHCLDTTRKGARVWGFNLYDRYGLRRRPKVGTGGQQRDYGYTTSPVVHGDEVLVEVGGNKGTLMAFDRRTGKERWTSECRDLPGHTGAPALMRVEGIPCVAVLTLHNLVVIRLDRGREGQTVARYPWATEFANNIASPAAHGDCVLVTSAYNKNAIAKLRVSLKGITRLWEARYPSKACTPVIHRGHLYVAWQKVRCLDWDTGKLLWEGGAVSDPGSCVVTADDRLIVWGQTGRLLLVDTAVRSPANYRELVRRDRLFSVHAWPHVALASGRLVVKDRRGNLKSFILPAGREEGGARERLGGETEKPER